ALSRDAALARGAAPGWARLGHRLQPGSLLLLIRSLAPGVPDVDEDIAADTEPDKVAHLADGDLGEELQQPKGRGHGTISRRQEDWRIFSVLEDPGRRKECSKQRKNPSP